MEDHGDGVRSQRSLYYDEASSPKLHYHWHKSRARAGAPTRGFRAGRLLPQRTAPATMPTPPHQLQESHDCAAYAVVAVSEAGAAGPSLHLGTVKT